MHTCAHTQKVENKSIWESDSPNKENKPEYTMHSEIIYLVTLLGTPSVDNVVLSFSSNWAKELLSGSKNQVSS